VAIVNATTWLTRRQLLDRVVATPLLVASAPIMLLTALWVRLVDGSPSFVTLDRIGRDRERFGMVKLRTMTRRAASGPSIATTTDDRLLRGAEPIRRWRLDELPNLVSVLFGKMALIGPRPEAPDLVPANDARWSKVCSVPPAVTGLSQLLLADWEAAVLSAEDDPVRAYDTRVRPLKTAIDHWYVQHASPRLDAFICFHTCRRALGRTRFTHLPSDLRALLPSEVVGCVVSG
jgi:lipopolysaccharide/colanic/teichoic acid biosynthesis glycosyltransferase